MDHHNPTPVSARIDGSARFAAHRAQGIRLLPTGQLCVQHRRLRVRASIRREPPIDFILMLTRHDRTVEDAGDLIDVACDLGDDLPRPHIVPGEEVGETFDVVAAPTAPRPARRQRTLSGSSIRAASSQA